MTSKTSAARSGPTALSVGLPDPVALAAQVGAASRCAESAADRAGVVVREVSDPVDLAAVAAFLSAVWQAPPTNPPVPAELLRSLWHAGGAVHVAFDESRDDRRIAGAAVAVFAPPEQRSAYSMVAAAASSDRGVGFAVKQAQRVWALARGATTMSWTFDPLVGRNARFNLVKLGAVAVEYAVDFYGPMEDGVNGGDESDRLTARWNLLAPSPVAATAEEPVAPMPSGPPGVRPAPDGGPLTLRADDSIWCRVPSDILELRRADPPVARAWRLAVREVFVPAFEAGFVATGLSRDGWYHLTHWDNAC